MSRSLVIFSQTSFAKAMKKILILFGHPALEKSRINQRLIQRIPDIPGLTFHDLYQLYPDFYIDVQHEQELLLQHDIIVLQHPLYWYSVPPLMKQWIDLVLEHGWAYGRTGNMLAGKKLLNVFTAGGGKEAYCDQGYNRYTIREFMRPFEQTACLCSMSYLPPFVVHGTHKMSAADMENAAADYQAILNILANDQYDTSFLTSFDYLNDIIKPSYEFND